MYLPKNIMVNVNGLLTKQRMEEMINGMKKAHFLSAQVTKQVRQIALYPREKFYVYKISASIFYKVKGMVLKGVIYIFVKPNTNFVLAFSLKNQQVLEQMDTHHYPSALNVTEMKEIVSFYAQYELGPT